MTKLIDRLTKAANRVHPECVVEVTDGVVEVLLPEDCGLLWHATEGTMLIADAERFDGLSGAIGACLDDVRMGAYTEEDARAAFDRVMATGKLSS
jgi:hypothetical protein